MKSFGYLLINCSDNKMPINCNKLCHVFQRAEGDIVENLKIFQTLLLIFDYYFLSID